MTPRRVIFILALLCALTRTERAFAQQTVTLTIPPGVGFTVTDVSRTVTGTPGPFRVIFSNSTVRSGNKLYVSVKADSTNFSGPGTTQIPASKVSWTATVVGGGTGSPGTLSSAAYTQVYQSNANPKSGEVDMTWTLASIAAAGLRAGTHTLTVRWRVEAF